MVIPADLGKPKSEADSASNILSPTSVTNNSNVTIVPAGQSSNVSNSTASPDKKTADSPIMAIPKKKAKVTFGAVTVSVSPPLSKPDGKYTFKC